MHINVFSRVSLVALIWLVLNSVNAYSQSDERVRRSFIGGSLGISFPKGDFASNNPNSTSPAGFASNGIHFKLVQAAFVFKSNIGIAGAWYGSANELESASITGSLGQVWGYGGILIGPMYTFPVKRFNFDIKTGLGYTVATILESSFAGIFRSEGETVTTLAYNLGIAVRYHITKKASLMWEFDFFVSDVTFNRILNGNTQKIRATNLSFGAAFRL